MKELSIHISDADVDGFFYWMFSGSILLYRRYRAEGETVSSVISRECTDKETRVKIIWDSRNCILVPSSIFKIEDMTGYLRETTEIVRYPQCIQCGEFVAVWDVDHRIEEIRTVAEETAITVLHTHQRVEHITQTQENTMKVSLIGSLLYITKKNDSQLEDSFVAEVHCPEDAIYYIAMTWGGQKPLQTDLPDSWTTTVSQYFDITPIR